MYKRYRCASTHLAARRVEVELPEAISGLHKLLVLDELLEQPVSQQELRLTVGSSLDCDSFVAVSVASKESREEGRGGGGGHVVEIEKNDDRVSS